MKPFFSIIIPTFNRRKSILRCVDSVLSQTFDSLEVIVVDDCSDDDTLELLACLSDPRLHVIQTDG